MLSVVRELVCRETESGGLLDARKFEHAVGVRIAAFICDESADVATKEWEGEAVDGVQDSRIIPALGLISPTSASRVHAHLTAGITGDS